MLRLTGGFVNVYDRATGLLSNTKGDAYYEGTYVNYSFRQLPDMEKRIALCPGGERRVISDYHFRKKATEYDRKPAIKWLSCTAK